MEYAQSLNSFIARNYPHGIPFPSVKEFYAFNPVAAENIQTLGLKKFCEKYPKLIHWSPKGMVILPNHLNISIINENKNDSEVIAHDLNNFILNKYPNGIEFGQMQFFYNIYPKWKDIIRDKGIRSFCELYPHLFDIRSGNVPGSGFILPLHSIDSVSNQNRRERRRTRSSSRTSQTRHQNTSSSLTSTTSSSTTTTTNLSQGESIAYKLRDFILLNYKKEGLEFGWMTQFYSSSFSTINDQEYIRNKKIRQFCELYPHLLQVRTNAQYRYICAVSTSSSSSSLSSSQPQQSRTTRTRTRTPSSTRTNHSSRHRSKSNKKYNNKNNDGNPTDISFNTILNFHNFCLQHFNNKEFNEDDINNFILFNPNHEIMNQIPNIQNLSLNLLCHDNRLFEKIKHEQESDSNSNSNSKKSFQNIISYKVRKRAGSKGVLKANETAMLFYEKVIKNQPEIQRYCEDRNMFNDELRNWRDYEKYHNDRIYSGAPSEIIYSLKIKRIIDVVIDNGNVIVWNKKEMNINEKNTTNQDHRNNKKNTRHLNRNQIIARVRLEREKMQQNKNNIDISSVSIGMSSTTNDINDTDKDKEIKTLPIGQEVSQYFEIKNNNNSSISVVVESNLHTNKMLTVSLESFGTPLIIKPYSSLKVKVSILPKLTGVIKSTIAFKIKTSSSLSFKPFSVYRFITLRFGDNADDAILQPTKKYTPKRKNKLKDSTDSSNSKFNNPIKIIKPKSSSPPFCYDLQKYNIPDTILAMSPSDVEDTLNALYNLTSSSSSSASSASHEEDKDEDNNKKINNLLKLNPNNYPFIFHMLLWLEEQQMKIDIETYDMINVKLYKIPNTYIYKLKIPGLAENRPSVLKGDTLTIRLEGNSFEGYVEKIELEYVHIRFPNKFNELYVSNCLIDIRFRFRRLPLQLSHQALDGFNNQTEFQSLILSHELLFPNVDPSLSHDEDNDDDDDDFIIWNNPELNPEQRQAVHEIRKGSKQILSSSSSSIRPPYIIFGPPGTGKTSTLVESILQVAKQHNNQNHILVCAPSNTATDLILEKISDYFEPSELLRIMAYSRDKKTVPPKILRFTNWNAKEESFILPTLKEIKNKKIILVTLSTAGKFPNIGLLDWFTHVFMDEAGHSIEPEAIAAMMSARYSTSSTRSSLSSSYTSASMIVLAGDHKQLGPIIRSTRAKEYGLETSLLERLSLRKCYCKSNQTTSRHHTSSHLNELSDEDIDYDIDYNDLDDDEYGNSKNDIHVSYNKKYITKLVHNYRSHPCIIKLPNELFYENELIVSGNPIRYKSLEQWEELPHKNNKFPMIFHGIIGEDKREEQSPSWFNPEECKIVKEYVQKLLKTKQSITASDIGIITPYHKQAQKLKQIISKIDIGHTCKIGSVDEFQGMERRIIIISTVRSSVEYIEYDIKYQLGFISNPKRFNVAITRAQALLIVIGNPYVLSQDKYWNSLLNYCIENNSYIGCDYDPTASSMNVNTLKSNVKSDENFNKLFDSNYPITSIEENENNENSNHDDGEAIMFNNLSMNNLSCMDPNIIEHVHNSEIQARDDDDGDEEFVLINASAQEGPAWAHEE